MKESTQYENMIGVKEEEDSFGKLPISSESPSEDKEWKKHWVGMPEFEQKNNPPYKQLIISFRNAEDYEEFAKLIQQPLTTKTKSTWYPRLDRDANSLKRWIEIDE
jgi:hypothetical protein